MMFSYRRTCLIPWFVSVMVSICCYSAGVSANESDAKTDVSAKKVSSIDEAQPYAGNAAIEFVDKHSGQRRDPTPEEVRQLMIEARKHRHKSGMPKVVRILLKNGSELIPLPPEFDHEIRVDIDAARRMSLVEKRTTVSQ